MRKTVLVLASAFILASASGAFANGGPPHVNGYAPDYPTAADQGYTAMYEGRAAATDPAPQMSAPADLGIPEQSRGR
jgi:hypothetical protein